MRQTNTPLRKKDLAVVKIVDWSKDKDEPAIDVEVYINGLFDIEQSKVFSISGNVDKYRALELARHFAADFILMGKIG